MSKYVFEVLDEVKKAKSKKDKLDVIQKNKSGALYDIIRATYDEKIEWLIPTSEPPYTPNEIQSIPSNLLKETAMLKYCVKGAGHDHLHQARREKIFIGILEAIHPLDAKVLLNAVGRKPIPGLTKKLAMEVLKDFY